MPTRWRERVHTHKLLYDPNTHVVDLIFGFAYMNPEFLKCIFQGKTVSIGKDLQWSQHVLVEKYRGATYVCVWRIVVIKK